MNQANSEVLDGLERTRMLLTPPENWTTGAYARNKMNRVVLYTDPKACKFCLVGGLQRVTSESDAGYHAMQEVLSDTIQREYGSRTNIIHFNDNMGHDKVLSLLDSAITHLKGQQQ